MTLGRLEDNTLPLPDTEVSGRHVVIKWDTSQRCWQVTDTGSLNGTFLNGKTISTNNRKQGREHRLSSDDMMQLGSYSKVRYQVSSGIQLASSVRADRPHGDMTLYKSLHCL